jgi:hypothetical protein
VYTNGSLRIVRASDALLIKEIKLQSSNSKVDNAIIAFKSFINKPGETYQ